MSDSDDTNVLLLIPPDFFNTLHSSSISSLSNISSTNSSLINLPTETDILKNIKHNQSTLVNNNKNINNYPSDSYYSMSKDVDDHQSDAINEIKRINRHLQYLDQQNDAAATSSTCNPQTNERSKQNLYNSHSYDDSITKDIQNHRSSITNFQHSTPKPTRFYGGNSSCTSTTTTNFNKNKISPIDSRKIRNEGVHFIEEIDNFIMRKNPSYETNNRYDIDNNEKLSIQPTPLPAQSITGDRITSLAKTTLQKHADLMNKYNVEYSQNKEFSNSNHVNTNENLCLKSLGDYLNIAGNENNPTDNNSIHLYEERLRRQHCEESILSLQAKLLEYEQKFTVALAVDKKKDETLSKINESNLRLAEKIKNLELSLSDVHKRIAHERQQETFLIKDVKIKNNLLENELRQSAGIVRQFTERNELLEIKIENLTKTSNEVRDIHRKQLEDYEVRASNFRENEKLLLFELNKLKTQNEKLQQLNPKENEILQHKNDKIKKENQQIIEKLQAEQKRCIQLNNHICLLEQKITQLNEKEKSQQNELETQRGSLKSYYQTQLEKVVAHKLDEFQKQLDSVEETLKDEAKQRELLIADRAIKQIELINQKNDQEFLVLSEKHNEETELYRIQLEVTMKKIKQLEEQLFLYQSRRVDMAERLHTVMETQWQRAMEIITSPSQQQNVATENSNTIRSCGFPITTTTNNDLNRQDQRINNDSMMMAQNLKPENEIFETPTTSRINKCKVGEQNSNYNDKINDERSEKLQQYVELLLKTSPRDLNQILNLPKKTSHQIKKVTGNCHTTATTTKVQPWK